MVARSQSGPIAVKTMPSGSIAVPRHIALSASRLLPSRNMRVAPGGADPGADRPPRSAELEDAGAPAAGVGRGRLRGVTAARAVAAAEFALAADMHAVHEFVAAHFQPLFAAEGLRVQAATLRFTLAVVAEIVIGVELVLQ